LLSGRRRADLRPLVRALCPTGAAKEDLTRRWISRPRGRWQPAAQQGGKAVVLAGPLRHPVGVIVGIFPQARVEA
jgi:hypothetical protein